MFKLREFYWGVRALGTSAQVAKWGSLTNKTKELNTNANHYSRYTPNIFSKIKASKGDCVKVLSRVNRGFKTVSFAIASPRGS